MSAKKKPAFRLPRAKCLKRKNPPRLFAKRSFRWIRNGTVFVLVACPRGSWNARRARCRTAMKAVEIVKARRSRSCPAGWRMR